MSARVPQSMMPYTCLFLLLMPCVGCGYGPDETVTVKITGVADEARREQIAEELKGLTDGSSHSISNTFNGGTMTVELAPVSDVDAFVKKIEFGEVSSVAGRTVEVVVGGTAENEDDAATAGNRQVTRRPLGFDSPQAAFDGLNQALNSKDPDGISAVLTAESQTKLAGALAFGIGLSVGPQDEANKEELLRLWEKYGFDRQAAEERGPIPYLKVFVEGIDDEPAFIVEMLGWIEKNVDEDRRGSGLARGRLENVKVEGETATGTIVTQTEGNRERTEPIEFQKVQGRWLVQLPYAAISGQSTPPSVGVADNETPNQPSASTLEPVDIPDKPISGTLFGREFRPDRVEVSQGDLLTIRQGEDFFADAELKLFLFLEEGESLAGKKIGVSPSQQFGQPHVHATVRDENKSRTSEIYTDGYRLHVSFQKLPDERLSGRLYLKLPDKDQSVVAGTFTIDAPGEPSEPADERGIGEISGKITVPAESEGLDVWVGCLGPDPAGNLEGPGTGFNLRERTASATCLTWKPRNTTLSWNKETRSLTHKHVNRPPGWYLVSVRGKHRDGPQGGFRHEGYYDWKWVEITEEKPKVTVDLTIEPEESGTVEVTLSRPTNQRIVTYLPLDENGRLPLPRAHTYKQVTSAAKIEDGKAVIRGLREGRYQIAIGPWQGGTSLPSATVDVDVKRGVTTSVELNPPAAASSRPIPRATQQDSTSVVFGVGFSTSADARAASSEAAQEAAIALDGRPAKAVLVFHEKQLAANSEKLLDGVGSVFDRSIVYGCSGHAPLSHQSHTGTLGVLAIAGDIEVTAAVAETSGASDDVNCGQQIGRALKKAAQTDAPGKLLLLFGDCRVPRTNNLVRGVAQVLGRTFPIVGGAAFDGTVYVRGKRVDHSNLGLLLTGEFHTGFSLKRDNSIDGLVASAREAVDEAIGSRKNKTDLVFVFDCVGRRRRLLNSEKLTAELAAMKQAAGTIPLFGFYGNGEIGQSENDSTSRGVGLHISACAISAK